MSNEIVLYQSDELPERIEVKIDADTVWLNRQQMANLFGRDVKTIGKHINNVFREGELVKELVVANFATTTQPQMVVFYNLDVIISVGYRVKSKQGTQFRIWETQVMSPKQLQEDLFSQLKKIKRVERLVAWLSMNNRKK